LTATPGARYRRGMITVARKPRPRRVERPSAPDLAPLPPATRDALWTAEVRSSARQVGAALWLDARTYRHVRDGGATTAAVRARVAERLPELAAVRAMRKRVASTRATTPHGRCPVTCSAT